MGRPPSAAAWLLSRSLKFLFRLPAGRACFAAAVLAGAAVLPSTGRAQLLGSLTEGAANSPYTYYLTIQFDNGHYYDFTLNSSAASYTGTAFINTVSAGSQGTAFVLSVTQVGSSYGNYISGITVNTDTNSGFANNNYWAYWNGSATTPVQWTYSQVGEDGRTITSGQADGWVYGTGSTAPTAMTFAVPEPSTWVLAGVPLAGLLLVRRTRRGRGFSPATV